MKMTILAVVVTTFVCWLPVLAEEARNTERVPLMKSNVDFDKARVVKEVTDRFTHLVSAINQKDVALWEKNYSRDEFISAVAGGDLFGKRDVWVKAIASNFSMRDSQHFELRKVQVIPLTPDTALLTSQEMVEMRLQGGQTTKSKHAFTMIWKKGQQGWQIIHSHESWADETAK